MVGGSGSRCFGSHDAQRVNDPSTTGKGDANGSYDRCQRPAGVSSRAERLEQRCGRGEEACVSGSGGCEGQRGSGNRQYNVTGKTGSQTEHRQMDSAWI